MTKKIATFIARAFQPYSVVEDASFIDMINYYAMPDYVCVTVHVMDQDFMQHVYVLACREMPEDHTAENILRFLQAVIEEWDLPDSIPIFVVTDNARNFVSAVARSPWLGLQCFAHMLQLCINDAKKEVAIFSQVCAKARCIVRHYKRSARARGRLIEIQKDMHMNALEVVQDNPTRWNREYSMMERLVKLRAPISAELPESDFVENLSTKEWKLMAAVVKVLQPLQQATAELSADRYPTLSQVIPLLHCTHVVLQEHKTGGEEAAPFAYSLARSLATRFPNICYITQSEKKWARALLTTTAEELAPAQQEHVPDSSSSAGPSPSATTSSTVWAVFISLSSSAHQETAHQPAAGLVTNYLSAPLLPRKGRPLEWWKTRGSHLYPGLVKVAQKYLAIPATQTKSERLFSTTGNAEMFADDRRFRHLLTARIATAAHKPCDPDRAVGDCNTGF
ncbi:hypothetical protein HPB47_006225 [Ixodes persulcatus]|uniref:Uncharacterized protein n=1 Tax=Ixodes persulcatus TaxID=34615 RepID=A0AC60PAZ2_IXOPE|nr:hypothetical protein HPB47_006225 [Ixodes persulcatus]